MKYAITLTILGWIIAVFAVDRMYRTASDAPPAIASAAGKIDKSTCAECHPGIVERFESAPHSRTLWRGDDPHIISALAGKSIDIAGQSIRFDHREDQLWVSNSQLPFERRVDWVFGSGQHAMTPVSIDVDPMGYPRLTQFNASLLSSGKLAATPGTELAASRTNHTDGRGNQPPSETPLPSHGITSDAADTRRCFGCHVSYLPQHNGRIELSQLVPNVDCTRCHPGAEQHAASGGDLALGVDWTSLTPLESINRCGECHRRADEFTPDELDPSFTHLIRFAPVGMAMSPCFRGSQLGLSEGAADAKRRFPRFDCMTCHDPHQPAATDAEHYNVSCRTCHVQTGHVGDDAATAPASYRTTGSCTVQPQEASCIECHMPKVGSGDGLDFTDHWIRVR